MPWEKTSTWRGSPQVSDTARSGWASHGTAGAKAGAGQRAAEQGRAWPECVRGLMREEGPDGEAPKSRTRGPKRTPDQRA